MAMEILSPGALTTIQDMGRSGYASRGFQENGACDRYNYRIANLLAGNFYEKAAGKQPAVLEMTLQGVEIRFTSHEVIAAAGADMKPELNGAAMPMYCPVSVKPGDHLKFHTAVAGLRTYLAVHGGFDVPLVMGSRSTSLKMHLGGLKGRKLKTGDLLLGGGTPKAVNHFRKKTEGKEKYWMKAAEQYPLSSSGVYTDGIHQYPVLRAVAGPQQDAFTKAGLNIFSETVFHLSAQSDRMACKMTGPEVERVNGSDIISDGIVPGSVQVASDGMPIVMMADHQTTGGYAKIATVISADMPRLAQLKPGDGVTFQFVTPQKAVEAARKADGNLRSLQTCLMELSGGDGSQLI